VLAAGCAGDEPPGGAVETMVLETCAPGGDPAADDVCRCAYDGLVERFGADQVARFDEALRSDPDALPADAERIILDCTFAAVAPPTSAPAATSTTSTTSADDGGSTTTTEP
jgi:hypothetical protein